MSSSDIAPTADGILEKHVLQILSCPLPSLLHIYKITGSLDPRLHVTLVISNQLQHATWCPTHWRIRSSQLRPRARAPCRELFIKERFSMVDRETKLNGCTRLW